MITLLILCHFIFVAAATTMTKLDSTQLASMLEESCMRNLMMTTHVESIFECLGTCTSLANCTIALFHGSDQPCQLLQLFPCNEQSLNMTVIENNQDAQIWIDKVKFQMSKSKFALDQTFNKTLINTTTGPYGEIQVMLIPTSGCYNLTARGAASGHWRYGSSTKYGCLGAVKGGSFMFNAGDELRVVVGQEGGHTRPGAGPDGSGAGGASFVFTKSGDLLLAAGGAGGVYLITDGYCSGQAGLNAGRSSNGGTTSRTGYGGENGTTGRIGLQASDGNDGGVAASWFSSGPPVRTDETWGGRPGHNMSGNFSGGLAPPHNDSTDGLFEAHGGFGGGGSGSPKTTETVSVGNGGSGGGYSSGGAGSRAQTGGGGSSFASPMATNVWGITGGNTEAHGSVTFTYRGPTCG